MKPTPEQIAAMEARGWTWQEHPSAPDVTMFRASAPGLGLMLSVWWDVNTGSGWHWTTNAAIVPNKGKPSPLEAADEAETWLREVLGGFRFPWLKVAADEPKPARWSTRVFERARRRAEAEALAARVVASVASDGVAAMQELDHLRGEHEDRRVALVAALNLPPETTWADALAWVVPVPAEQPAAKGCHGCAHRVGESIACSMMPMMPDAVDGAGVWTWQDQHLSNDLLTPKPGAPECPGRTA